ncbi:type VII secretion protein EccB [Amycolatopsis antarctica]|uniref:Type VII secretion protein EccB n=1 Tax=Amycolatopsis antarctica TaxID=1854586 RepID=A0A263D448_9PSEU|nr:type VII secretion protein EccB [Amycolatopsis antarctica]OZM72135.1 type VII secretion protein EccB [Amycolatopsis antarctica]
MQSAKDQVQAHQFTERRLAAALVLGDATGAVAPARRAAVGVIFGVVVLILGAGGFFVFGLLSPGASTAWREPGSIIVEEETGSRYVFADGVLRPTRNLASAALATEGLKIVSVPGKSLAGVPRGAPLGLLDAPEVLPRASALHPGPILMCVPTKANDAATTVVLDATVRAAPVAVPDVASVVGPDGERYLVADGRRHAVTDRSAETALGMDAVPPVPVSEVWLDTVPLAAPVAPYRPPQEGAAALPVAGSDTSVGELFRVDGGGARYYLMLSDGLAALSPTDFALSSAEDDNVRTVTASEVAEVKRSETSLVGRMPDLRDMRYLRPDGAALCATAVPFGAPALSLVDPRVLRPGTLDSVAVALQPGGGMLAVPASVADQEQASTQVLITEPGVRYSLAGDREAVALGYGSATPRVVPNVVLDALPAGVRLSIAAVSTQNGTGGG